jgi:translocation and assembly module TamB
VIDDINAQLSGNPLAGMDLKASARSGEGQATIEGQLNLAQSAPALDITIRGEDVQVVNTSQAIIHTSPDLQLTIDKDRIHLRGDMSVPSAQITLREIPQSAIKVSSDQILIDKTTSAPAETKRKIDAQVRTKLGDNVTFSGFGLSGRLSGEVVSSERPGEATTAQGEVQILDGRYRAYGQNLTIETGRLLFSGAGVTNPVLDLRATRQPTPDIRVGVVARGTLQKPEFALFSDPTLTERNQLSYLLLGRPADTASSNERSALGEAALAFGLNRTGGITDKISQQFGLDHLGVQAEPGSTSEQAAFVIGKYLAPKLYVSYGIGLFEPINTLRMQYSIDQHWKLVTESSGEASGGDITYSVERGR